jgi:hypothetical protein
MGAYYLTELADWLRAAGLRVVEQDGWKTRSRSSGGFESGRPWCVMWHHTASSTGTSAANDCSYMSYGSESKPIANLYIARDGEVWVLAGGATNTNGKGDGYRTTSRGVVPVDSMNTYAVGMEIGNNGIGEAYSPACIDAAFTTSLTVCRHLGLQPADVIQHYDYAPDRKVDPATASAVQGGWRPDAVTTSGTWQLGDLHNECNRRAVAALEPPEPEPPEDDMPLFIAQDPDDADNYATGDGIWRREWSGVEWHDELRLVINDRNRAGHPVIDLKTGRPITSLLEVAAAGKWGARLGVSINDALD